MLYVNPMSDARFAMAAGKAGQDNGRTDAALEEFERVFVYQLLREMRKSAPASGLFGKAEAYSFMEEMMDDALAGSVAQSKQLGIAAQIRAQMDAQEGKPEAASSYGAGLPINKAPGISLQTAARRYTP